MASEKRKSKARIEQSALLHQIQLQVHLLTGTNGLIMLLPDLLHQARLIKKSIALFLKRYGQKGMEFLVPSLTETQYVRQ